MSELPEGWYQGLLGEVVEVTSGVGFPMHFQGQNSGDLPFFKVGDISRAAQKSRGYLSLAGHYVSYAVARQLRGKPLEPGSTVFAKIGEAIKLNRRAFIQSPCLVDNNVMAVKAIESQLDRYIYFFLLANDLTDLSRATTVPSLRKGDIESLVFPLPPLNEQKRIADKLDALLARVDACRERLDRVPLLLKRFRQAVLAAATSGRLTEKRREEQASHQSEWHQMQLGDLLVEKPRNGYSPRAVEFETPTRSLTLTATTSGRFDPNYFKYINEGILSDSHLWLQPDDILIQRANTLEYVGVSAIYDGPPNGYIYPDLMMKCRANNKVLTKFLHYVLLSDGVRSYFRANATGTAGNMPKINQQTVIAAPVLVPSIEEQHEIVRRVEALFACADRLEARYKAARAHVERLTPALLAKAFRGELVPQDPNDEPASVLLERIRAARAGQIKTERHRQGSFPNWIKESA